MAIRLQLKQSQFLTCYELSNLMFSSSEYNANNILDFLSYIHQHTEIHGIPAKQPITVSSKNNINKNC